MQNHGILVYMECADGQPVKAGLEALNAAQRLAAQQGGKPVAAVLLDSADAAAEVGAYGAAEILSAPGGWLSGRVLRRSSDGAVPSAMRRTAC